MRRQKATFKKRAKTSAKYFLQADRRTVDERMKKYSVITGLWATRTAGLRTVTHMTVRMTKIIHKMATARAREGTERRDSQGDLEVVWHSPLCGY